MTIDDAELFRERVRQLFLRDLIARSNIRESLRRKQIISESPSTTMHDPRNHMEPFHDGRMDGAIDIIGMIDSEFSIEMQKWKTAASSIISIP